MTKKIQILYFLLFIAFSSFTTLPGDWYIKEFHSNGVLKKEGWLLKKQRTAYWYCYFPNGKIMNEGSYKEDQKDGYWKTYYQNNQLKSEGYYKNGNKIDWWKYYNQNGTSKSKTHFEDGKKDSWVNTYDLNGNISSIGKYVEGKKDYFWKYYSNSKLIKKEEWNNGVLNWRMDYRYNSDLEGLFEYYKNDILISDGSFQITYDIITYFDKDGEELYKQNWE